MANVSTSELLVMEDSDTDTKHSKYFSRYYHDQWLCFIQALPSQPDGHKKLLWVVFVIVSSYQSQYQAGQSRWCSRRWKGVYGSCCPRRRPWRWTGQGARHRRSSSPTNWPLAGRSGRSQPPWSGAYVREKLARTQQHSQSTVSRKDYSCLFHLSSNLIYSEEIILAATVCIIQ